MMLAYLALMKRDLLLAARTRQEILQPLLFFAVTASLFPLALNPDPKLLQAIAPGVLWVSALLALLLSLDKLFNPDYQDGSLQQLLLSTLPLSSIMLIKALVHWLLYGLPLLLIVPLFGMFYQLPHPALMMLIKTLCLGTPTLSLLGTLGAAMTVGLRQTSMLLALLILPLVIPVLIFAASAVAAVQQLIPANAQLAWLAALMILAIVLTPFASAEALRLGCQ